MQDRHGRARLRGARHATINACMPDRKRRGSAPARPRRVGEATAAKLIEAASKEFRQHGFFGTDTNKIARRAGFAPQTFYRWFGDKEDIFVAVYRAWEAEEVDVLAALIAAKAPADELVDAVVRHHRAYRRFRRSLRQLAVESTSVRKARAKSRLRQIERIRAWAGRSSLTGEEIAPLLLQIERLCDAIAEDEFADLNLDEKAARAEIAGLLMRLRK